MESNAQALSAPANGTPQIVTLKQACSEIEAAAIKQAERAERLAELRRQDEEHKRQREAQERDQVVERFGKRYRGCNLHNYVVSCPEQQVVMDALGGYVKNFGRHLQRGEGVVLFGPPGTGKDHLAVATCIAIYDAYPKWDRRHHIAFATGLELYQDVRDNMKLDLTEWQAIKPLIQAPLLLLSDPLPPRGPLTDWQACVLLQIIDGRYRALSPTIVTLNIANGAEGDERMGAQTLDRLKDGALSFYCNWPSYRKAQP
jgi:DNA replication protein DnaC